MADHHYNANPRTRKVSPPMLDLKLYTLSLYICLFVCLLRGVSVCLWLTLPYQGWNLRYQKSGRGVPLHRLGNRPLCLQGAQGICRFEALAGCRLAARSIIIPTLLGMLGCWLRDFLATLCSRSPQRLAAIDLED